TSQASVLPDALDGAYAATLGASESLAANRGLSDEEAYLFDGGTCPPVEELCALASQIRDKGKGKIVTFSPKVFIPLTHLCRDFCGYCTFRHSPDTAPSLYMTPEEVLAVAKAGERLGCTEALFTLGERPEQRYPEARQWLSDRGYATTLEYLTEMCRLVMGDTGLMPHANPGTMSRRELAALQPYNPSMGLMLESTSPRLYQEGGPHEFAPSKRPRVRLRTMELAGELGIPFTTGLLIGIGETRRERIDAFLEIRALHRTYGHIQEVIVQNFRAKPATPMEEADDASADELLWTVAVGRILLGPDVNLQVPPNLSASDYPAYLDAGINDWGGVSPLTIDFVNPEAPWPALPDLQRNTRDKGFELKPRLPVYPEYFMGAMQWLPEPLRAKATSLADEDGYVKGGMERYAGRN
ncbi:7,8-didemethyl-8-hydroxy-5-deazariboflavin synthase, partial [Geodia barretti]